MAIVASVAAATVATATLAPKSRRMLALILLVIVLAAGLVACRQKAAQDDTSNTNDDTSNASHDTNNASYETYDTSYDIGEVNYEVISQTYAEAGIQIDYPQMRNLGDPAKESAINEMIKDEALKILLCYQLEEAESKVNLEVAFKVTWQGKGLLSVQYSGYGYVEGAAHPNQLFYTTNINLISGKTFRLADVVVIDRAFVDQFRGGELVSGAEEEAVIDELKAALQDYLSFSTDDDDLMARFHKADFSGDATTAAAGGVVDRAEIYSYFTEDSLGISIQVPHALGDYARYELQYSDIEGNINKENEIWREILR